MRQNLDKNRVKMICIKIVNIKFFGIRDLGEYSGSYLGSMKSPLDHPHVDDLGIHLTSPSHKPQPRLHMQCHA